MIFEFHDHDHICNLKGCFKGLPYPQERRQIDGYTVCDYHFHLITYMRSEDKKDIKAAEIEMNRRKQLKPILEEIKKSPRLNHPDEIASYILEKIRGG